MINFGHFGAVHRDILLQGLALQPRESDILIVTSPKAGTTLMQQMVHQLRTGGDDAFDEIGEVVPWIELAHDLGQDIHGEHRFSPRVFKTHAWFHSLNPGGKRIVVLRHPTDVAVSFYHFFANWFFTPETGPTLDEFVDAFWLARGKPTNHMENAQYTYHLVSWWKQRHSHNTLIVLYEDLVREDTKLREIRRIAKFTGLGKDDAKRQAEAARRTSFAYMKDHERQFDEHLTKKARNHHCDLPKDAGISDSKVRKGRPGAGRRELSWKMRLKIACKFLRVVFPATLCPTYSLLALRLRAERMLGFCK